MSSIRLWQNEDIGLIGRDRLLERAIFPRVTHPSHCFVLKGPPGSGKTALLEWAHCHDPGKSALISAIKPLGEIYRTIIDDWDLDLEAKGARMSDLENAILGTEGHSLYVDDLDKIGVNKRKLHSLKILAQYHKVHAVISSGAKLSEDAKQLLMGREIIPVKKLPPHDALRLARKLALHYKSKAHLQDVVHAAGGLPLNIVSLITRGEIPKASMEFRTRSEEIDISPVFVLLIAGVIVMRVLGRGVAASDLAAIGALAMVVRLLMIPFLKGGKSA